MTFYEERAQRTKEWSADRFGMFIHWGLYAIPARGEWVRYYEEMDVSTYQTYFDEFNPDRYNPKAWARLAKKAGMKYAVLTTKHHDGFCLFDSAYTEYKAANTPAKRDLVAEYVDAFRAEGIKVGFYYSLIDWYHDDYPAFGDKMHPMRKNKAFRDKKHNFKNYIEYFHNQVRELLTNYGEINILWFDFAYDDMSGEKWEAQKLMKMIRSLQPNIIVNDRLGGNGRLAEPPIWAGDLVSPEQFIPAEGVLDELNRAVPWESCRTLNNHWGYCADDTAWKASGYITRMLSECVSKGGNLILNVGPDARGEIPRNSADILESIGLWLDYNGKSVYGCGKSDMPPPTWGYYTQNKERLYAHIYESDFHSGVRGYRLEGLRGKVKKARLLADGSEVFVTRPLNAYHNPKYDNDDFLMIDNTKVAASPGMVVELELK